MRTEIGRGAAPITGWDRGRWAALADRMLLAARGFASADHGRITFPGAPGGYGRDVDGLEGFARTFLMAGFRLAGEKGTDPHHLAEWYAEGIAAGTDPHAEDRWVRLDEHGQAKVEAASLALILDLTRPWIWDRLDARVQEQVVEYLSPAVGDTGYPLNNWCWFRLVVQTFLRSVGGPSSLDDMRADLAVHDSFVREEGWLSDGVERSYDHYAGWALHLYPTLWARMRGAEDLAAERGARDVERLDRFLVDQVALVGADGSPLIQGRSLTYRFAAAAPFWVGALAGVPSTSPGLLRRAASGIVSQFADRGAPDDRGILTIGWHDEWRRLAQSYTGPSSPYWAAKGMLGLALPADHPAWTRAEEPLPVERGDVLRALRSPGWLVSGTRADGIVRVVNHGTDHARRGDETGDSPLYARLGYSTATCPWLDDASWRSPEEQSVTLVTADGTATHRTGWTEHGVHVDDGEHPVGVGASTAAAHWIDMPAEQHLHGSGWTGEARYGGEITVVSLVRGPWEVRLAHLNELADGVDADGVGLRISGWPVLDGDALTSTVTALVGDGLPGVLARTDASPLGARSTVPWVEFPAIPRTWTATLITLAARSAGTPSGVSATAVLGSEGDSATVTWPDGVVTTTALPMTTEPATILPATTRSTP